VSHISPDRANRETRHDLSIGDRGNWSLFPAGRDCWFRHPDSQTATMHWCCRSPDCHRCRPLHLPVTLWRTFQPRCHPGASLDKRTLCREQPDSAAFRWPTPCSAIPGSNFPRPGAQRSGRGRVKIEPPLAVGHDPGLPPHAIASHPGCPVVRIIAACWGHPINTLANPAVTLARTPRTRGRQHQLPQRGRIHRHATPRALSGTIVLTGLGKPASDGS